ncbi:MAG: toll/interleukin-1 receptor domain-containing protein [Thermoguttaceae bacterium]
MRPNIPAFLWQIGTGVENLIQQHDALEHWRDHVRRWAPEETSPTDLIKILYSRSLDAKYALLAAIHDLCFDSDQAPPINPWADDLPLEVVKGGISYLILKEHLLPDAQRLHRGLDVSESARLKIILDDVARSLPADSTCRQGDTQDFDCAANAKDWLQSRVRPRIEALHSCFISWTGNAATNTAIERLTVPASTSADPNRLLSLIQQDMAVVRDWALRKGLPGVPPPHSHFSNREAAQAAFSEWCAYLETVGQNKAAPSTVDELLNWIRAARRQLRDRESEPIGDSGMIMSPRMCSEGPSHDFFQTHQPSLAYTIQEQFLGHLKTLCPDKWAGWYQQFAPKTFRTVLDLDAMMAWVENEVAPLPTTVKGNDNADSTAPSISVNSDASTAPLANQEKDENMASLRDERLASLYRQFLRAAEQFPFVRCAAVRQSDGQGRVSAEEWCGLLGAPWGCSHIGCGALVLIDGQLWEAGCYLTHGDYDPSPECAARINAAIAEVERLSRTAGSCFGFRPLPSQPPQPQLGIEWEWLRAVLDMPFVHKWDRLGLSVREMPDDFFTASARAIEELTARQTPPPTSAVERDDRSGTRVQIKGSESAKLDAAAGSQVQGKRFRVALSFPGEHRAFVVQVADVLADRLERRRVFYDKYYEAELARPNLDTYLQQIYHDDSDLIAVFLCAEYEKKDWCGLEWRAIRDLIKKRASAAIMPFRFDATTIPGLFSIDGYVEIGKRSPGEVASLILERLEHNDHHDPGTR